MKTIQKKQRKGIRRSWGVILAAMMLLMLGLPVWFPWVARPVLARLDLSYQDYERVGFTRFRLHEVAADWGSSRLRAKQVEGVLPSTWLWQKISGHNPEPPTLIIWDGILSISNRASAASAHVKAAHSSGQVLEDIDRTIRWLETCLPAARLTNCAILLPSMSLELPAAEWQDGTLRARIVSTNSPAPIELEVRREHRRAFALALDWAAYQAGLHGTFTHEPGGWNCAGELSWLTNRARLSAQFTTNGWWPAQARLDAQDVRVPAALVHLKNYHALTGTLAVNLVSNQFSLQSTGFARPTSQAAAAGLPVVQANLSVRGTPESVILEQLNLEAPFAQATLTNALGIQRTGHLLNQAARLQLSVNLGKVPGLAATGQVNGEVRVEMDDNHQPVAHFDLAGTRIAAFGSEVQSARLQGKFAWPLFTVADLTVHLADGSMLAADGAFDLSTKSLKTARWQVDGAFLKQFFTNLDYTTLEASGTASGPLTNLAQTGTITVNNLQAGAGVIKPLRARATWQADGWQFVSTKMELSASDSVLTAEGAFDLSAIHQRTVNGTLHKVSLRRKNETLYALQQPCPISFRWPSSEGKFSQWKLAVNNFDWRGDDRELALAARLDWPFEGSVRLNVRQGGLDIFKDFFQPGPGNVVITQMDLAAGWTNGPVHLTADLAAAASDRSGQKFTIHGRVEGGDVLKIQQLSVGSGLVPALDVTGTLPLRIVPSGDKRWLVPDEPGPIDLKLSSQMETNGSALDLGSYGKLELAGLQLQAHASGTWAQPSVALTLTAPSVHWRTQTNLPPAPAVKQLKVDATITPGNIELRQFAFTLEDHPVSASGEWPLPAGFWTNLWHTRQLPDWRNASGQVRVQKASLTTLARYFPEAIAPAGDLDLNLTLKKGGRLDGWLALTNVSTRPLGVLPPLRDITARIRFDGSEAVLEKFDGRLGGQPLAVNGTLSLSTGGSWNYQFQLKGTNVPLMRSVEFLLRGDMNLRLQGGTNLPPALSGTVKLRHGLYVRHVSDLLWSGPSRPALHPPYFSVTNQPFAGWKLDVEIQGDHFLHVQTPVFAGVVSANAKLDGTLRAPVLTGDARINSGWVKFPFGTLEVSDGYASLSGNDPRGPDLQLHASGLAFDYGIRLDVTGPLDGAIVIFSSTPPLNSEEILLLLTAGQVPQDQYAYSTQARAGRLATYLGRDWFGRFTGNNSAKPRLIIRSGEQVSEGGNLTYSAEYRLSKHWSIVAERDQFDDYNANLKWRIISR